MDYYLTEQQHNEIAAVMPKYLQFSYACESGHYIHNSKMADNWNFQINNMFIDLYGFGYQSFLDSIATPPTDAEYFAGAISNVYQPIGLRVVNKFMGRNKADGITHEQSNHTLIVGQAALNYLSTGALSDALKALDGINPDDMTEDYHWVTQEKIDLIKLDIYTELSKL